MIVAAVIKDDDRWVIRHLDVERTDDTLSVDVLDETKVSSWVSGLERAHSEPFDALVWQKPRVSSGLRFTVTSQGSTAHSTTLEYALERALEIVGVAA